MGPALYNEIATTCLYEMNQQALMTHARLFLTRYQELSAEQKNKHPEPNFILSASSDFAQKIYLGDTEQIQQMDGFDSNDSIINVIKFSGPMMRNGGACAYGSKELRDKIIDAANCPQCFGQLFIVDTPGGSSATKDDLKEAIDYAKAKGQFIVMQVDGQLCSAGMAWGAMCHKIYARNAHNTFGCMGTYAAFYTNKDKDVNAITQETLHIVYADNSPKKNYAVRQAAEGNDEPMREYINSENNRYLNIIRQGRPNVTPEQLEGGDWEAAEVIGTLCDGIKSFEEIVEEMVNNHTPKQTINTTEGNNTMAPTTETTTMSVKEKDDEEEPINPEEPGDPNNPVDPAEPEEPKKDDGEDENKKNLKNKTMGKKYEKIQATLGLEVLESGNANDLWLTEEMADSLNNALEQVDKTTDMLNAKAEEIKQLNSKIHDLNQALEEAANKTQEFATVLAEKEEDLKNATDTIIAHENNITELNNTIADKDSQIANLNEQLKEMEQQPATIEQPATVEVKQAAEQPAIVLASKAGSTEEARKAHQEMMNTLRNAR